MKSVVSWKNSIKDKHISKIEEVMKRSGPLFYSSLPPTMTG